MPNCQLCGESAEERCSACKTVYYCRAEHQRKDWNEHRKLCVPPGSLTVKGILLPAKRSAPEVIAVQLARRSFAVPGEPEADDGRDVAYIPKLQLYIGDGSYDQKFISTANGHEGPMLKHCMRIFLRDNFLNDGSPHNKCVANLLGPSVQQNYWRGDLLVVKMAAEGQQGYIDGRFMDVSLEEDLEPLKRWLEWYGSLY
ncbi:unnamed protein product [Peniophora sp. CBMAI 1063]|nr:unnamed protein product [Peniophora sp. CBMAI 1063]